MRLFFIGIVCCLDFILRINCNIPNENAKLGIDPRPFICLLVSDIIVQKLTAGHGAAEQQIVQLLLVTYKWGGNYT